MAAVSRCAMHIRAMIHLFLRAGCLGLLLASFVSAQAQTVSGFTNTSGWSGMKINSTTYISDLLDNPNGTDLSSQSGMNGANAPWDMVGDQSLYVFQVATGTTSSGDAVAFSVRLGNFQTNGLKQGSAALMLKDTTGIWGYGLQFSSNGALSVFRASTSPNVAMTPSGFTFTWGNDLAASNGNSLASGASTVLYNYQAVTGGQIGGSDAWLTWVISLAEIRTFRSNPSWTYNPDVGALAFTSSNALNGNVNADYQGATGGTLVFSSQSGTVVPEFPTALILGAMTLPFGIFEFLRRRRAAKAKGSA